MMLHQTPHPQYNAIYLPTAKILTPQFFYRAYKDMDIRKDHVPRKKRLKFLNKTLVTAKEDTGRR